MPNVTRGWRAAVTAAAAVTLTAGVMTSTAAAQPRTARPAIAGTHPGWATTSSRRVGTRAVTAGTVSARIYLAGRDPRGLTAFSTAVSTPGNALYGHYLTASQTMARFGPSKAEVAAVEGWLTGQASR